MYFPACAAEQQQHHHHLPPSLPPPSFQVPPLQLATQAATVNKASSNWIELAPTVASMPASSADAAFIEPPNLFVHLQPGGLSKDKQIPLAGKMPAHSQIAYVPSHYHGYSIQAQQPKPIPMTPICTPLTRPIHAELVARPSQSQAVLHCHQSHAAPLRPSAAALCHPFPQPSSSIISASATSSSPITAAAVPIQATAAFVGGSLPTTSVTTTTSIASCNNRHQHGASGGKSSEGLENANNKNCNNGDCWSTAVTGWEQAAIIKNKIGLLINGRFRILQSIASGSYGEIFAAEDLHQRKHRVAVKFDGACRDNHLRYEYQVYKSALYEDGNGKVDGFPQVYWYGHEYGHNILVMELLGAPVASLFAFCDRKFARQTIVSLGEQMIHRIRHLHQRGFIHRDIKPENFLMGLDGKESTLYLIDFGLARRYRYRENRALTHIPFRRGRSFIGTAKYASLNSHKNSELSRRDDVESLAYVLIELINGHLPWKNISKRNATTRHQTSVRIRMLKEQTNWEEFCPSMANFIRYCREIPFNEEPDYDRLLDLLRFVVVLPAQNNNRNGNLTGCTAPLTEAAATRNCLVEKKTTLTLSSTKPRTTMCCQTPRTAEKMTQVDFETTKIDLCEEEENDQQMRDAKRMGEEKNGPIYVTHIVANTMQHLSLKVASAANGGVGSDAEEVGAATTTTSCSDNELVLDSGGDCMMGKVADSSVTGEFCSIGPAVSDGDDELTVDSQSETQQGQPPPPVCRKCRRLRDQQNQQKRPQLQLLQQGTAAVSTKRMEQSLQTEQKLLQMASSQRKMCWQQARDSNPERRFQYENRFSWTVDKRQQQYKQQQQFVVQAAHLQQQQQQRDQLAPCYKLRAGAALPLGVSQVPPQIVPFHKQQHVFAHPQFILQQQQQAHSTNGQILSAHPLGIVMPNTAATTVLPAAVHQLPPPFRPYAEAATRAVFTPQAFPNHHQNNVQQQLLLPSPAAMAARQYILPPPPPQQPPSMAAMQCQQQISNIGTILNCCSAQQSPKQQQRRFMHIAFVLPPIVDSAPASQPAGMKQDGTSAAAALD